ncbi:fimbrial protein [Providencia burhodogranariea]|uniref:Fimbrial subunit BcfE n=1 Tax=Providencia burhodogranariea DSM 19968 TaxID=1141662 RepID=K8WXE7_9GAMM|nr:fimbrial protein [Providencia burhodogranariea]EKT64596.1 fimbrial subunit BcfE [Providencia burhodogranariea DSM 19968]
MNIMNNRVGICLLLILFGYTATAASSDTTDNTIVTITGKAIANTCSFDSLNSELIDVTVAGKIKCNKINSLGSSGYHEDVKKIEGKVEGIANTDGSNVLKNINTSNAGKGVGLYLYQNEIRDKKFDPQGSIKKSDNLTKNQDATLIFRAAYVGTSAAVVAGNMPSTMSLMLIYM